MTHPPKNQVLDSKTLAYDFEGFCRMAKRLPKANPVNDRILYNAFIESFAIHCRALLMFFYGHDYLKSGFGKPRANDVLATDFCDWKTMWPTDADLLQDAKFQADKHVAHIVTERQDVNFPGGRVSEWKTDQLARHVVDLVDTFLAKARPGSLDCSAERLMRNLVAEFKPRPKPLPTRSTRTIAHSTTSVRTAAPLPARISVTGKTTPHR